MQLLSLILIVAIVSTTISINKSDAKIGSLDTIFQKYGDQYNVDWKLLKAIATVESSLNPDAKNPSDPSYGLMQIYCTPDGKGGCTNKFNINGWPPKSAEALLDPELNVMLGAQIIAWNLATYPLLKAIAVYNSWSARNDPPDGPFVNQDYVDKVATAYVNLGGSLL
ncbi:MAG: transglycosylase SLT domain-containing protein [Desulfobacteraceae bacterium]|jgi:soluble lytic murein transglycosylase-like protein